MTNMIEGLIAESNRYPQVLIVWGDNCAPCASLKPKLMELSKTQRGFVLNVVKASANNRNELMELKVRSVPTVIIWNQGKEITRFSGDKSADDLYSALARAGCFATRV